MTEKPIDMFPRTDAIKNDPQTSIPSTRPSLSPLIDVEKS